MRCLFTTILCLLAMQSFAQLINSPADLGLTADQFKAMYGTVNEYNMQEGLKYNSSHGHKVMLIGAKGIWLSEIPKFCVEVLGCSRQIDTDEPRYPMYYFVYPGITGGDQDTSQLEMAYMPNDDVRMQWVKIIGNKTLVLKLFVYYWDESPIQISKLKKGVVVYKDCGSDRVTFDWRGKEPFIKVTKNPLFKKPIIKTIK